MGASSSVGSWRRDRGHGCRGNRSRLTAHNVTLLKLGLLSGRKIAAQCQLVTQRVILFMLFRGIFHGKGNK